MLGRKMVPALLAGQMMVQCAAGWAGAPTEATAFPGRPLETDPRAELGLSDSRPADRGSDALLGSLPAGALRQVVVEVLERNPEIAGARQLAVAAALRAPQVRALPDPVAALTVFALPPETRVGPQQLSASIQQKLPWFGKLALEEQAALFLAAAAEAEVEMLRLAMLTEARLIGYELAFMKAHEEILQSERETLVRYENISQARYASGAGLQQEIVRIQAQITRTDTRLIEISERRSGLAAALNALRDRPADAPVGLPGLPEPRTAALDLGALRHEAMVYRPEISAADARIAASRVRVELAERGFRPDLTFGLSYTAVGQRDDAPGRANPPPDNGDDVLALTASLNLPVRRRKLESGVEAAHAKRRVAEEGKRRIVAEIEGAMGGLATRIPLLERHLELLESVLFKQAKEVLRSTETAYSTGELNAMDLLDAEVVLFDVQISTVRTRADLAIAMAELERVIAHPIRSTEESRPHDP